MTQTLRSVLAGVALLLISAQLHAGQAPDTVQAKDGNRQRTLTGTIVKDDFSGISVSSAGAEEPVKRADIISFNFGALANSDFDLNSAIASLEAGDANAALEICSEILRGLPTGNNPPAWSQFVRQHAMYYAALSLMRQGNYAQAERGFNTLCARNPNNPHFFDAKLNEARCIELGKNIADGKSQFGTLERNIFPEKRNNLTNISSQSSARDEIDMAIARARLAQIRIDVEDSAAKNDTRRMATAETQLTAWGKENVAKFRNIPLVRGEFEIITTRIALMQKKFDQLLPLLNRQIAAQLEANNRESLAELYFLRAEAFLGMADAATGADKLDNQRSSLVDYLRVILTYNTTPAILTKCKLQAALLFEAIQDKSWRARALVYLREAVAAKVEPYSSQANTALARVNKAQEKE